MSWKVLKPRIWERLRIKLNLEDVIETFDDSRLLQSIRPIVDIDNLLKVISQSSDTQSITGTGVKLVATVPVGERWTLKVIHAQLGSGTFTFTKFRIEIPSTTQMSISNFSSVNEKVDRFDGQVIVLPENTTIHVNIDSYSVTGNLTTLILYDKEDAY